MLSVGDNIYENGIENPNDYVYANKIMQYFQKENIKNVPLYIAAGNHDCYSDLNNEIGYSKFNS